MNPLELFENEYFIRRLQEKTVRSTLEHAAEICFSKDELAWVTQEPLWLAACKLSTALDEEADVPGVTYHNRYHFQDAVLAAALLGLVEPGMSVVKRLELLAIMTAHDIHHDGTVNTETKSLEKISADAFLSYMVESKVPVSQQKTVTDVILSTDPKLYSSNYKRYQRALATVTENGDILVGLAHDADLFGSLLPTTGLQNTDSLVQEWAAHGNEKASSIGSFEGRAKFLTHVKPISRAARLVGLAQLCQVQLNTLATLANSSEGDPVMNGAFLLDALPRDQAKDLFLRTTTDALAKLHSPGP